MTSTDFRILVQKDNQLNSDKAIKFIEKQKNAKLLIIHSSLKDDKELEKYMKELMQKVEVPLIGLKVNGTYTKGDYYDDVIVVGVLCGDMDVEIYQEKINYENPKETADNIKTKLQEVDTCLVYTAMYMKRFGELDVILRHVSEKHPKIQIWGGNATPAPMVFTNEGFFKDAIAYAVIKNIKGKLSLMSGYKFRLDTREYTITKADNNHVYEIDHKNAVEVYCALTKARPWFINMYIKQSSKPNFASILGLMAKANDRLYNAVKKTTLNILGRTTKTGRIEMFPPVELDEERGVFITHSYTPNGTKLRWIEIPTEKTMLQDYNTTKQELKNTKAVIGHICGYRSMIYNFKYKEVNKILKQKQPYIISYLSGEIASMPPFDKEKDNLTHAGTINALGIR